MPAPAYPRFTQDSSDSEDEDIHWFSTEPPPPVEDPPDQPPAIPEHPPAEEIQTAAENMEAMEPIQQDISVDREEEDIVNDAVSIHGDEDLENDNNIEAAETVDHTYTADEDP